MATLAATLMLVTLGAANSLACLALDPGALDMRKLGEGEMKVFGVSVYRAALWSTAEGTPDPASDSVLLSINYARDISKERIIRTTRKEWQRLDVASAEQQEAWLRALDALLPDVKSGDQLTSLVLPGQGTRFFFGATEIGRVPDPQFGEAFLSIWLDERTRAARLRAALLTQSPR